MKKDLITRNIKIKELTKNIAINGKLTKKQPAACSPIHLPEKIDKIKIIITNPNAINTNLEHFSIFFVITVFENPRTQKIIVRKINNKGITNPVPRR